jgi:hypothetical protein
VLTPAATPVAGDKGMQTLCSLQDVSSTVVKDSHRIKHFACVSLSLLLLFFFFFFWINCVSLSMLPNHGGSCMVGRSLKIFFLEVES